MIYQYEEPTDGVRLVVESDSAAVGALAKLLTLYKLRSKVKIQKANYKVADIEIYCNIFDISVLISSLYCYFMQAIALTGSGTPAYSSESLVCVADPRLGGDHCRRLLLPGDVQTTELDCSTNAHGYRKLMYQYGIPCSSDILNKIPLECNMDHLNYVDFSKGCYLGQELTARTKYKVA